MAVNVRPEPIIRSPRRRGASIVGGMVRPSALAVLRLITSSNLVGCCTGRSAGFAPFSILSTYCDSVPVPVGETPAIRHQPAAVGKHAVARDRRSRCFMSQIDDARTRQRRLDDDRIGSLVAAISAKARFEFGTGSRSMTTWTSIPSRSRGRSDMLQERLGEGSSGSRAQRCGARTAAPRGSAPGSCRQAPRWRQKAGDVAARPRKAGDQTGSDRIA